MVSRTKGSNTTKKTFLSACKKLGVLCALYAKCRGSHSQGGALQFLYIRRLGLFFRFKILNFSIFGGFQKNEYFFGYEDFVEIFWGHHKIDLYLGVITMHFRAFS